MTILKKSLVTTLATAAVLSGAGSASAARYCQPSELEQVLFGVSQQIQYVDALVRFVDGEGPFPGERDFLAPRNEDDSLVRESLVSFKESLVDAKEELFKAKATAFRDQNESFQHVVSSCDVFHRTLLFGEAGRGGAAIPTVGKITPATVQGMITTMKLYTKPLQCEF